MNHRIKNSQVLYTNTSEFEMAQIDLRERESATLSKSAGRHDVEMEGTIQSVAKTF